VLRHGARGHCAVPEVNPWVLLLNPVAGTPQGTLAPTALRGLLKGLGLRQVTTAPPTGDAVFCGVIDGRTFGGHLSDMIKTGFGVHRRALMLSGDSFAEIASGWPWPGVPNNPGAGHIWFLDHPSRASSANLRAAAAPGDHLALTPQALYHHAPAGLAHSPHTARIERLLGVPVHRRDLGGIAGLTALLARLRDD
jgi:uncharacterized protein (DUF1697 family)